MEYAAIFHDLGKLSVPEEVLNKPGKLTSREWDAIRKHPRIGADILEPVHSFEGITEWIAYHHERIDGTGYYHIAGDDIPLGRASSPSPTCSLPSSCGVRTRKPPPTTSVSRS